MNILLIAERRAGKTTACMRLVELLRDAGAPPGGVLCPGDDLVELDTRRRHVFLCHEPVDDAEPVGPFHILRPTIRLGAKAIMRAVNQGLVTFIDEYGILEWEGRGFHDATVEALSTTRCVIVLRSWMLEEFLERFAEHEFDVVRLDPDNRDEVPTRLLGLLMPPENGSDRGLDRDQLPDCS